MGGDGGNHSSGMTGGRMNNYVILPTDDLPSVFSKEVCCYYYPGLVKSGQPADRKSRGWDFPDVNSVKRIRQNPIR